MLKNVNHTILEFYNLQPYRFSLKLHQTHSRDQTDSLLYYNIILLISMLNQWALDNHICNKYLPTLPDLFFSSPIPLIQSKYGT